MKQNKPKRGIKLAIAEFLCYDFLCYGRGDFMSQQDWFHKMYKCYAAGLLSYARHLLRDASDLQSCAEDYAQMAFLQLYANQQAVMEHENIEAWLKCVVKNRIADDMRKLQMRFRRLGMPVDMEELEKREARYRRDVDDGMLAGEAFTVRDLLKMRLSEREYRLFVMLYLFEWPRERIARKLDIGPNALHQRIFRLQHKIRRILREEKG